VRSLRTVFEDASGVILVAVACQHQGVWITELRHSRLGRGARETHHNERSARQALEKLEDAAKSVGWRLKVVNGQPTPPTPMSFESDGSRLFRDARTGEFFKDESSFRPSSKHTPESPSPSSDLLLWICRPTR